MTIDYDQLYKQHGDSPRALDWSEEGQRVRFEVLASVIRLTDTVLDVGCGLGHFARFLFRRDGVARYIGIDAHEPTVIRARRNFGLYHNAVIEHRNFEGIDSEEADVVVASGIVNIENGHNMADAKTLLKRCFKAALRVAACNFLSSCAESRAPGRHYFDPEDILTEAQILTRRVTLRHDYRDNDFTIFLFK